VAQAHPQPKHLLQPHRRHLVARLLQVHTSNYQPIRHACIGQQSRVAGDPVR
jgi:hypothetical protein